MFASKNRTIGKGCFVVQLFNLMTSLTGSGYRYTRLDDLPSSSAEFFADTLQKQQIILTDQDRDLEKVGDSVQLLKNMSSRIGTELEEQSIMLDDLSTDMERTGIKMDEMMKKIAKVTNMNDGILSIKIRMSLSFLSLFCFITLLWIDDFTSATGYVVYCPCMGRFGNQMEHFLGMLAFVKALNRTLVLPPFIEYYPKKKRAIMVDFDKYFLVEPLRNFHTMIIMRDFIKEIAPNIWPPNKRKAFCWQPRQSIYDTKKLSGCHAKEGNPFDAFWDYSNISFIGDVYYASDFPEAHLIDLASSRKKWNEKFPADRYPVLSFISAPAAFPARTGHHHLQKYLYWSKAVMTEANKYVVESLERPFIGIHLRNGIDWENLCQMVSRNETDKLFGSAICTGDSSKLTAEMCLPSLETDNKFEVTKKARKLKVRSVFVSSDRNHYIDELRQELAPLQIVVQRRHPENLHVNLAILSMADHFIGNCVSTLSAFIYRQRKYASSIPKHSSFFAQNYFIGNKDEL
uniref:GDP-fucose protein O-fucosyltransferase 1 n=1 Tax=Elaeophora elaphi TaxID=1147741 RepID=A0A0R3S0F4_9BILA